jgi:hypothetical protein
VFDEVLAHSATILRGLAKTTYIARYEQIQENLFLKNVSRDQDYQRAFKGYYRVRKPQAWCDHYFQILETEKANSAVTFAEVLDQLYQAGLGVHPSFASKLVATVRPNMPVYDSEVRKKLGLVAPSQSLPPERRIARFIDVYKNLESRMTEFVTSEKFSKLRSSFDSQFPGNHVSDMKVMDFCVWQLVDA